MTKQKIIIATSTNFFVPGVYGKFAEQNDGQGATRAGHESGDQEEPTVSTRAPCEGELTPCI
jgi:hypothetical protein